MSKKGNFISGEDVKAAQHRINIIIHKGIMSFRHPFSNTYSESFQQKTNAMLVPAHFMVQRLPHETMISNVAKTIRSGYNHSVNEKKKKISADRIYECDHYSRRKTNFHDRIQV